MHTMKIPSKRQKQAAGNIKSKTAVKGSGILCSACGHKRQQADIDPIWQCPRCKRAYAKTGSKHHTEEEVKRKNSAFIRKRIAQQEDNKLKNKRNFASIAGFIGYLTSVAGLSCSRVVSNPVLLAIGGVIIIGAILYFASTFTG